MLARFASRAAKTLTIVKSNQVQLDKQDVLINGFAFEGELCNGLYIERSNFSVTTTKAP